MISPTITKLSFYYNSNTVEIILTFYEFIEVNKKIIPGVLLIVWNY